MLIENRTLRWTLVGLIVVLTIPLLIMIGMMVVGGLGGVSGGMMSSMSAGMMALCGLWSALVAAALIFLIVLLTRDFRHPEPYRSTSGIRSETDTRRAG